MPPAARISPRPPPTNSATDSPALVHATRTISAALPRIALALLAVGLLIASTPTARADTIVTFPLDGRGSQELAKDTLEVTLAGLKFDGVTCDAVLTVIGSGDLTQRSSGLGVRGGSAPLNAGESLQFTMQLLDCFGGTARLIGFRGIDLTFFSTDGEAALLSLDNSRSTTDDNFITAYAPDDDPIDFGVHRPFAFSLFGVDDFGSAGGSVSFRVDSVDVELGAASPVPEPQSLFLVLLGFVGYAGRRWLVTRKLS